MLHNESSGSGRNEAQKTACGMKTIDEAVACEDGASGTVTGAANKCQVDSTAGG